MGKPAARLGDTTSHGSPLLGSPCPTVLIGGKPAWRIGDQHTCPIPNAPPPVGPGTPHGPGVTTPVPDGGTGVVIIGGKPAARVGDIVMEPGAIVPLPPPNNIVVGEFTVLIGMGGGGGGGAGPCPGSEINTCGDPVDVVTGDVIIDQLDIILPGYFPLAFTRMYRSSSSYVGPLGQGWSHAFDQMIVINDSTAFFKNTTGQMIPLPSIKIGEKGFNPDHKLRVSRPTKNSFLIMVGRRQSLFIQDPSDTRRFLLHSITDTYANQIICRYDDRGRLIEIEDTVGRILFLSYEGQRLIAIRGKVPKSSDQRDFVKYHYQGGLLVAVEDALGYRRNFEYTEDRLVCHRTALGYGIYYQYDSFGRCIRTWGEDGYLHRVIYYDPQRRHTLTIDSLGRSTLYTYNEAGVVETIKDPKGGIRSVLYDDKYNRVAQIDEKGSQKIHVYDDSGREVSSIDPNGNTYRLEYNQWDRPTAAVYPNGIRWEFEYDDKGSLITSRGPNQVVVRYFYNDRGQLVREDGPGGIRQLKYDTSANVIEHEDFDGTRQHYRYDAWGRLIEGVDNRGTKITLGYDELDQVIFIDRDGSQLYRLTYDAMGNLLSEEDALGQHTDFHYNGWGYVVRRIQPEITLPDGRQVRPARHLTWDTEGNLIEIRGPGQAVWHLQYDHSYRLIALEQPGNRRHEYILDLTGNHIRERDSQGIEVTYEYDDADQLRHMRFSDGNEISYSYDELNRLVNLASVRSQITFEWDENDMLLSENVDGTVCKYKRDIAKKLIREERPNGDIRNYKMGPNDRVDAIVLPNSQEICFSYDGAGNIREIVYPNGVVETYDFDAQHNRLTHNLYRAGKGLIRKEIGFDEVDRISSVSDSIRGETVYAYDSRDFLVKESRHHGTDKTTFEYQYDLRGNIVSRNNVHFAIGDGSEVLHDGYFQYTYDGNGRLTSRRDPKGSETSYKYNSQGLLIEVHHAEGKLTTYEYDLLNRRIAKDHSGDRVEFHWVNDVLIEECDIKSGLVHSFIYLPGSFTPIAHIENFSPYKSSDSRIIYYHTDILGAPTELSDDQGEIVLLSLFLPEPASLISTQSLSTPLRFPGQYFDDETGFYYNGNRYYDPFLERYTTPDPVPIFGGPNVYAYGLNRVNWVDPLGLWAETPLQLLNAWKAYGGPFKMQRWIRRYNNIRSNSLHGENIENIIRKIKGLSKPGSVPTSKGPRFPDGDDGKRYHEIKSGYAGLCAFHKQQIEKDAEILKNHGKPTDWHLLDGYSQTLLGRLRQVGLNAFDRAGKLLNPRPPF